MTDYEKMQALVQELKDTAKKMNVPIAGAQQLQFYPSKYQARIPQRNDLFVLDGSYLLSLPVRFKK